MRDTGEEKKGFFRRLVEGLTKTRNNIVSGIDGVFRRFSKIDDEFYEELEEILIMGDLGVHATEAILEDLQEKVKEQGIREPAACKELLIDSIRAQMDVGENDYAFENRKSVILIVGVNGVGKTTSIGKLAARYKAQGKKVLLAAADTFRAAATEQLTEWAHRADVDIIAGQEGSDPGAVVYDAIQAAKARNADILLVDTAGRLHNKKNLMNELGKINRIIDSAFPEACRETLVVLDGTTGQNALAQAKQFGEISRITGIILTKLDGTAKGGIAVAIQAELNVPVKYIGVGERIDDLQRFDADAFVNALFDRDMEDADDAISTDSADDVKDTDDADAEKETLAAAEETFVYDETESAAEEVKKEDAIPGKEMTDEQAENTVEKAMTEVVSEPDLEEKPEDDTEAGSGGNTETEPENDTETETGEEKEEEETVSEIHFSWHDEEEEQPEAVEKPKKGWFRRLFE